MKQFICPVSMQIPSAEHYERDLKHQLIELGYKELEISSWSTNQYLITFYGGVNRISNLHSRDIRERNRYFIDHYNPHLFLALAAMTNDVEGSEGEYYYCRAWHGKMFKIGNIYPVTKGRLVGEGDIFPTPLNYPLSFRKATKEEIIEHFSKISPEKDIKPLRKVTDLKENEVIHCPTEEEANAICRLMHEAGKTWYSGQSYLIDNMWILYKEKTCYRPLTNTFGTAEISYRDHTIFPAKDFLPQSFYNNKPMKNRVLSRADFKRIHDIACGDWKPKLIKAFEKFAIQDEVQVEESFYKEMRAACTSDQHKLFDEIFGKDTKEVDLSEYANQSIASKMIEIRKIGNYQHRGFYLSSEYNWEIKADNLNVLVLIPTYK